MITFDLKLCSSFLLLTVIANKDLLQLQSQLLNLQRSRQLNQLPNHRLLRNQIRKNVNSESLTTVDVFRLTISAT